jgi:hypothetical protein
MRCMDTTTLRDHQRRIDARIKAAHDARHPDCGRWEDFQQEVLVGRKRTPDLLNGFGCPDHHVWIEGAQVR